MSDRGYSSLGLEALMKTLMEEMRGLRGEVNELRNDISSLRSLEFRVQNNEQNINELKDCHKETESKLNNLNTSLFSTESHEEWWHRFWYGISTHGIWILLAALVNFWIGWIMGGGLLE